MKFTVDEIPKIARLIIQKAEDRQEKHKATIIAFSGELGSGKTTLIKEIAQQLGVVHEVQSPTFVIYKIYETANNQFKKLIHADMYRIEHMAELQKLALEDLLQDSHNLFCIEWPEKVPHLIPEGALWIKLHHGNDEKTRTVSMV